MSEVEMRVALEESLVEKPSGDLPQMKTDYRRLEAVFVCTAGSNVVTCSRYKVGMTGGCTFWIDNFCGWRE